MAIIRGDRKLGDLRESHSSKKSFNKAMRMDAKFRYIEAGGELVCKKCGSTDVHICHIIHISEFNNNIEIKVINSPKNLLALCAYHHRIFDNRRKADFSALGRQAAQD